MLKQAEKDELENRQKLVLLTQQRIAQQQTQLSLQAQRQAELEKKLERIEQNTPKTEKIIYPRKDQQKSNEEEKEFQLPWKRKQNPVAKVQEALKENEGMTPEEIEKLMALDKATKHLPKIFPPAEQRKLAMIDKVLSHLCYKINLFRVRRGN